MVSYWIYFISVGSVCLAVQYDCFNPGGSRAIFEGPEYDLIGSPEEEGPDVWICLSESGPILPINIGHLRLKYVQYFGCRSRVCQMKKELLPPGVSDPYVVMNLIPFHDFVRSPVLVRMACEFITLGKKCEIHSRCKDRHCHSLTVQCGVVSDEECQSMEQRQSPMKGGECGHCLVGELNQAVIVYQNYTQLGHGGVWACGDKGGDATVPPVFPNGWVDKELSLDWYQHNIPEMSVKVRSGCVESQNSELKAACLLRSVIKKGFYLAGVCVSGIDNMEDLRKREFQEGLVSVKTGDSIIVSNSKENKTMFFTVRSPGFDEEGRYWYPFGIIHQPHLKPGAYKNSLNQEDDGLKSNSGTRNLFYPEMDHIRLGGEPSGG